MVLQFAEEQTLVSAFPVNRNLDYIDPDKEIL